MIVRLVALCGWIALPLAWNDGAYVTAYAALFGMGLAAYLRMQRLIGPVSLVFSLLAASVIQARYFGLESSLAGVATAAALFASPRHSRIAAYLGGISYSLYLVHVPLGGKIVNLALRAPDFPYRGVVIMAIAIAGSLVAADLFHRIVEKRWIARSKNLGRSRPLIREESLIAPTGEVQAAREEVPTA